MEPNEVNTCTVSQKTDQFVAYFNKKKQDIENYLLKAEQLEKDKLPSHFELVIDEFQMIQKYLSDSVIFLPLYNVRVAQDSLKQIQETITTTQNKLIPKKRFAFKKKLQTSEKTTARDITDGTQSKIKTDHSKETYPDVQIGFQDKENSQLELQEEINGKDVSLAKLTGCIVKLFGSPNTLHITNLHDCTILSGPVTTSIFLENCKNCNFILACQQLRVHSVKDCIFYLHVTSRAIIEDSNGLKFAPFNWVYKKLEDHYKISGLDPTISHWDTIDDFNWLSAEVASPNWSLLEEALREEHSD